jgi:hypothetical protein
VTRRLIARHYCTIRVSGRGGALRRPSSSRLFCAGRSG